MFTILDCDFRFVVEEIWVPAICVKVPPPHVSWAYLTLLGAQDLCGVQRENDNDVSIPLIFQGSMNQEVLSSEHFHVQSCQNLAAVTGEELTVCAPSASIECKGNIWCPKDPF